jgi:hypothetical protein
LFVSPSPLSELSVTQSPISPFALSIGAKSVPSKGFVDAPFAGSLLRFRRGSVLTQSSHIPFALSSDVRSVRQRASQCAVDRMSEPIP